MKVQLNIIALYFLILASAIACSQAEELTDNLNDNIHSDCNSNHTLDQSRGECTETLNYTNEFSMTSNNHQLTIKANGIPEHKVGLFGAGPESLNPNPISAQNAQYNITTNPQMTGTLVELLSTSSNGGGPKYVFGITLNGVELDPVAAEPFPHEGPFANNVNWEWNLEATNVNLGLDCNNAHVQPNGKYHYHGAPTLFLEELNIDVNSMNLIGYAADGFPIYYKYAYANPMDMSSGIVTMRSSYTLKEGERPGDGITAPCGKYDGIYSNDYEYIDAYGHLDEANGRFGLTPEYPEGIYYYVITDEFPSIPRYFKGTPSNDFKIGF